MVNMLQNVGVLSMLGALALNVPHIAGAPDVAQPTTLSGYVEAAQNDTLKPDPIVGIVTDLCPVMAQAAKEQGVMGAQLTAACGLLQTQGGTDDLLAMLNN